MDDSMFDLQSSILDLRPSILDFPAAVFAILFQPSQLRFQQRGLNSRSGNCLMINRACARRAFDVTLFLLLVLTSSFGQVLFKARQERARPNSNSAGPAGTPAP